MRNRFLIKLNIHNCYFDLISSKISKKIISVIEDEKFIDEELSRINEASPAFRYTLDTFISNQRFKYKWLSYPIVEMFINGKKGTFMIDTGAQMTVVTDIFSIYSECLKNNELYLNVGSSNGEKEKMEVVVGQLIELNNNKYYNMPILIIPTKKLQINVFDKKVFGIDGILGWDILKYLDFEIDFKKKVVKFGVDEITTGVMMLRTPIPSIILFDANKKMSIWGLDTGAKKSCISVKFLDRVNHEDVKTKLIRGIHGTFTEKFYIIKNVELILNDFGIKIDKIGTGFTNYIEPFELEGVFGIDLLKRRKLRISNSRNLFQIID